MSSRYRWLTAVAVLLIAAVAIAAVFFFQQEGQPNTVAVRRGSLDISIDTIGRLVPAQPTLVRAPAQGIVDVVAVGVGDQVNAGDVLVTLDKQPFQQAIDAAQQQVSDAEAALNLVQQQPSSDPTTQKADQLTAEQRLRQAQAALDQANRQLADSMITSPVAGTVIELPVQTLGQVAAGTPVAQVANLADLELSIDLDEINVPYVQTGTSATFTLDAYPGQTIDGRVSWISPVATTSGGTTTFATRLTFSPPNGLRLLPGMNADVTLTAAARSDVLLIPESALRTVGQRTFVTVVTDGHQEDREIKIGLRNQGQVEVASGLSEGERVVVP